MNEEPSRPSDSDGCAPAVENTTADSRDEGERYLAAAKAWAEAHYAKYPERRPKTVEEIARERSGPQMSYDEWVELCSSLWETPEEAETFRHWLRRRRGHEG